MTNDSPVSTLVVFSHADSRGRVAPHVRHHLAALRATADRLVAVTTAGLDDPAADELAAHGAEVVSDPEASDPFSRWAAGLRATAGWERARRLVLADDDLVGPLAPLPAVLGPLDPAGGLRGLVEVRGLTPYLPAGLLVLDEDLLADPLVAAFWTSVRPLGDPDAVRDRYEVGLCRLVRTAGHPVRPLFEPSRRERARLTARRVRRAVRHAVTAPAAPAEVVRAELRRAVDPRVLLWDAALTGRLPYASMTVLRDAGGTAARMLTRLEQVHPHPLAGVREHVDRTCPATRRRTARAGSR